MKKSNNQNEMPIIHYELHTYMWVTEIEEPCRKIWEDYVNEKFIDPDPLSARQKVFEQRDKLFDDEQDMSGILVFTNSTKKDRPYKEKLDYFYTITLNVNDPWEDVVYEEEITNPFCDREAEIVEILKEEYSLYKKYGYRTGQPMKLENGDKILDTDFGFIYDI